MTFNQNLEFGKIYQLFPYLTEYHGYRVSTTNRDFRGGC